MGTWTGRGTLKGSQVDSSCSSSPPPIKKSNAAWAQLPWTHRALGLIQLKLPSKWERYGTYCWWFRNPANQLRLVVYPIIYRVFLHPRLCRISSVNTMRWLYVSKSSEPSCNAYCKLNINKTMVFFETSGSSQVMKFLSTMHQINRKMLGMAPSSDHQDYHIFSRGNPYKPLFVTVTGRGPYPRYRHLGLRLRQQILHQTRFHLNLWPGSCSTWVLFWNFLKACLAGPSSKPCDSKDDKDLNDSSRGKDGEGNNPALSSFIHVYRVTMEHIPTWHYFIHLKKDAYVHVDVINKFK